MIKKTAPHPFRPGRVSAPVITANMSYAKVTAGPRKDPSKNKAPIDMSTEDIKVLLSMISIIDNGEVALLVKKFKAEKKNKSSLSSEHAPLVEAIKSNKF
ncbi:hypothetical protein EVAR_32095_1 [Eumeta japonica]|uniref:Uncharacterized protein n=1 Tax=Eumeta variegata TaxID=151549 RepID=A0A4C1V5S0_EUMVA|nr:hypothetical protein EVAR_32095_1 [Eumeta japonica]